MPRSFTMPKPGAIVEANLQLPAVFKSVGLSRPRLIPPFPRHAAEHVQGFHYRYIFSCKKTQTDRVFTAQNEALGLLTGLNKLSVTIEVVESPACADKQCLSELRTAMQAVAAKARDANISFCLRQGDPLEHNTDITGPMYDILETALQPFAELRIIDLQLGELDDWTANFTSEPAIKIHEYLCSIFPGLAGLTISEPVGILWQKLIPAPNLRELVISVGSSADEEEDMEAEEQLSPVHHLVPFVNAVTSNLQSLRLHVAPGIWVENAPPQQQLVCPSLKNLDLDASALDYIISMVRSLPCLETIVVSIQTDVDWSSLQELLDVLDVDEGKRERCSLKRVGVRWSPHADEREHSIPTYRRIRDELLDRGTDFDVQIGQQEIGRDLGMEELHEWLTDMHDNFAVVRSNSMPMWEPTNAGPKITVAERCSFPKLRYVGLGRWEEERQYGEPLPATVSLLDRIEQAPLLSTIELAFHAPRSDYIPPIVDAIKRGALNGLQRLVGHCTVELDGWDEGIHAERREELEQVCREKGIDCWELHWRTAYMWVPRAPSTGMDIYNDEE